MRRIAVIGVLACCAVAAPQAHAQTGSELTDACRATPAGTVIQGPCRLAEQTMSSIAAHCRFTLGDDEACAGVPLSPRVIRSKIAEHGRSLLHRQLASQHAIGDSVPFVDAPWVGTHNSFNSVKRMFSLSENNANQQLTLTEQLDLDMRSIELDVHPSLGRVVLCHGLQEGVGCTTERPLADGVAEIVGWLDKHPREVLLVYLEDHVSAADEARLPSILAPLRPLPTAGRSFPALTRDAVRAAHARVVLVGGPGSSAAWRSSVFTWDPHEWESRPRGFANCRNAAEAPPYGEQQLIRFFEDSTFLTQQTEVIGQSETDDGLRVETVRAMVGCGVEVFGFDQLLPGDPRLPALVWSWGAGQDPGKARCTVLGSGARWVASRCAGRRRVACRAGGAWRLAGGRRGVPARVARRTCRRARARFAAPRTARENMALRAVAGSARPWLGR